jgi:sulfur transfer complex TusBCD TusB component (DsrH family)
MMAEKITKSKKIQGVKKNIFIFKKDKTIRIKSTPVPKKKSMDEAIKTNEVLLWGTNKIDSILLTPYEKNYAKSKTKSDKSETTEITDEIEITDETEITDKIANSDKQEEPIKIMDSEYIPSHKYNITDLDWLNKEYDRIENKISQLTEITEEYDNLLDLQDSLTELINELEYEAKTNNISKIFKETNDNMDKNKDENCADEDETLMEIEIKSKKEKSTKLKKSKKTTKLKPYYWIGEIPEGYREATEEEAIVNKKVSLFGKKRVNRELQSLFEITGTIYIDTNELSIINQQIMGLKGKLHYYKKELEFKTISLDSDIISQEMENEIKNKISDVKNCYKKTVDIYNLYVKKYKNLAELKNQNQNQNQNKM